MKYTNYLHLLFNNISLILTNIYFFRIFLYLLPGCTVTIIMIVFTVGFAIYHHKRKSSVSSGRSSPDESGEYYELQSIPSITKVSCIALTSNSKVWLG